MPNLFNYEHFKYKMRFLVLLITNSLSFSCQVASLVLKKHKNYSNLIYFAVYHSS